MFSLYLPITTHSCLSFTISSHHKTHLSYLHCLSPSQYSPIYLHCLSPSQHTYLQNSLSLHVTTHKCLTFTISQHHNTHLSYLQCLPPVTPRSSRLLDSPLNRLDKLFIIFSTEEGAVTGKGAVITIWRLKPLTNQIVSTMGAAITIWRFIANDQSNRLRVNFLVNNSSRPSSRYRRTISLDDRDYTSTVSPRHKTHVTYHHCISES